MRRIDHKDRSSEADGYWREKVCGDESWAAGLMMIGFALLAMCVA
jgi:hypothetical protein